MENYFKKLSQIECVVERKQGLSYVSWADAWQKVKETYPDANYIIYENKDGFPFWESLYGIDVKVGVIINGIEHISRLPVMDSANKAMKAEAYEYTTKIGKKKCAAADAFDINKAIQRAFTKAIAMHGIGLYVYRGEDLPTEETKNEEQEDEMKMYSFIYDKIINARDLIELKDCYELIKIKKGILGKQNVELLTNNLKEAKKVIEDGIQAEEDKNPDQITVEDYIDEIVKEIS